MKTKLSPFWIIIPLIMHNSSCKPSEFADHIFYHGIIYTADSTDSVIEAIAIKDDRIWKTGTDQEIMKFKSAITQMHDLEKGFVMPGLIEGHGHFLSLGKSLLELNLSATKSWQEILDKTKEAVHRANPDEWVEGRGWHQEKWIDDASLKFNGYPYHDALSAVSPQNPVILVHASGHALLANQKAMDLAGISAESVSPNGGRIVRDDQGKLTGVFEENAMDLITGALEAFHAKRSLSEINKRLRQQSILAGFECIKYGITSFQDAGSSWSEIQLLKSCCDSGYVMPRLWVMYYASEHEDKVIQNELPIQHDPMLRFCASAVKAYVDGALGSYGAWLLEAYADKHDFHGQNTLPLEKLNEIARLCATSGLQLCVHGIGDRANQEILNIFEQQIKEKGLQDHRWRIEHAQHLDPSDIPRFSALGVIASMQTIHCTSDAPFVEKRLGHDRAQKGAYAWRSLINSGAQLANGTDCPVESINPFECMYAAITRKRLDNGLEFFAEQRLNRIEALRSYTIWNAYAAKEEHLKGSIEPGKLADFILLDRNLLNCSDLELASTNVKKVWMNGRLIKD